MTDKSHVTMEQHVCQACGTTYDTGSILLDRRLRKRFDHVTVTGWGLCPEDAQKIADGYVILVEVTSSEAITGSRLRPEDADRTGEIAYLRKEVAAELFNVEIDTVAFVDPEVFGFLKRLPHKEDV